MRQGFTRRRFVATSGAALAALYAAGGRRSPVAVAQSGFSLPGLSAPGEILVDRWGSRTSTPRASRTRSSCRASTPRAIGCGRSTSGAAAGSAASRPRSARTYVEQDRAARLFLYRGDLARE